MQHKTKTLGAYNMENIIGYLKVIGVPLPHRKEVRCRIENLLRSSGCAETNIQPPIDNLHIKLGCEKFGGAK